MDYSDNAVKRLINEIDELIEFHHMMVDTYRDENLKPYIDEEQKTRTTICNGKPCEETQQDTNIIMCNNPRQVLEDFEFNEYAIDKIKKKKPNTPQILDFIVENSIVSKSQHGRRSSSCYLAHNMILAGLKHEKKKEDMEKETYIPAVSVKVAKKYELYDIPEEEEENEDCESKQGCCFKFLKCLKYPKNKL